MTHHDEEPDEQTRTAHDAYPEGASACDDIHDPLRRTLCKACGLPVLGEAPFCKDHEPPVP
ncbi:MAG: hypothetical protein AB1646_18685 [Thermodesulfobacteriota bacterium]